MDRVIQLLALVSILVELCVLVMQTLDLIWNDQFAIRNGDRPRALLQNVHIVFELPDFEESWFYSFVVSHEDFRLLQILHHGLTLIAEV